MLMRNNQQLSLPYKEEAKKEFKLNERLQYLTSHYLWYCDKSTHSIELQRSLYDHL